MATCPACQQDVPKDQQICPHCGAKRYGLIVRLLVYFLLMPGLLFGSCTLVSIGMNQLRSAPSGLVLSDEIPPPGRFPLIVVTPSASDPSKSDVKSIVWHREQAWRLGHPADRYSYLLPHEQGVVDQTFSCDAIAGRQTYRDCREQGTYRVTTLSPQRQLVEVTLLRSAVGATEQYAHQYHSRYEAEEHTIHPKFFEGPAMQSTSGWMVWQGLVFFFTIPLVVVLIVNWRLPKGLKLQIGSRGNSVAAVFSLVVIGAMMVIAVPNFQVMQIRARQGEARIILNAIHEAEGAFYKKHHRYGTFDEIGFVVPNERWTRYTYRLDDSGKPGTIIGPTHSLATHAKTAVPAGFTAMGFTATAIGNIDGDPTLDQWHVNDLKQNLRQADVNDENN